MSTKILYLDTETGGLWPARNALLTIGCILTIDGVEIERKLFQGQPMPGQAVDPKALEANGLTESEIAAWQSGPDMYREFTGWLKGYVNKFDKLDKLHLVGYNVSFDEDFLRAFFKHNKDNYFGSFFWTPSHCVMRMVAYLVKKQRAQLPNFKLATVAQALGVKVDPTRTHEALYDCELTYELAKLCDQHIVD